MPNVLEKYKLKYLEILPVQKGYRNESYPVVLKDGRKINVIFYKQELGIEDRIKRANLVSNYLHSKKFPARYNYDNRILIINSQTSQTYVSVYTYLKGETIPWESYTKKHIKLIGKKMSEMHSIMQAIRVENFPEIKDELHSIFYRVIKYLFNPSIEEAIENKLCISLCKDNLINYSKLLNEPILSNNKQILHMDFVRGNILFNNYLKKLSLTGVIDFEKTSVGNPIFDIARTLAFLIVDCKYKEPEKIRKYFLYSGYKKANQTKLPIIRVANKPILDELVTLFLVYDLYKFLLHNPYEYLNKNEHYVRTRDALIDRDMIHYI